MADPNRLASLLDFSIGPLGLYRSEDYRKLPERLVHTLQTLMRRETQKLSVREALTKGGTLSAEVFAALKTSDAVAQLGVEILNLSLLSIRPTPEMAKALEAEAREALQRRSDEAIYERRNNAVEQERRIKESELNTEIAVEEKRRQIRETQMAADVAIEQQSAAWMEKRVENDRKEADSRQRHREGCGRDRAARRGVGRGKPACNRGYRDLHRAKGFASGAVGETGRSAVRSAMCDTRSFLREGESLDEAALRELYEETGVRHVFLEQLYTFGEPKRDPRGRVITVVYYALIASDQLSLVAGADAAEAQWFPSDDLPPLAFDHKSILDYALERLRNKLEYTTVSFQLLPEKFTLSELQAIYEAILGKQLDKRNFRRKVALLGILKPLREWQPTGRKPAQLFRFAASRFEKLKDKGILFPF